MVNKLAPIQKLMEQHRFDEAGVALAALVQTDEFIQEQAGGAYFNLFMAYMDALIAARQEYNQALDVAIVILKAANEREREMKEGIDLALVHAQIRELQSRPASNA